MARTPPPYRPNLTARPHHYHEIYMGPGGPRYGKTTWTKAEIERAPSRWKGGAAVGCFYPDCGYAADVLRPRGAQRRRRTRRR